MSEIWPWLLLLSYFATLIFSVFKQRTMLREELKYFGWYLVIGLISALVADEKYQAALSPPCDDCFPVNIGLLGMIRKQWYVVVLPYVLTFTFMSLIRHLILLAIYGWKRMSKMQMSDKAA